MPRSAIPPPPKDFETAVAELERLVTDMESGQLSLEQSLASYKRGMELTAWCQKTLQEAEQQIKVLEAGVLKDFDADTRGADTRGGMERE